MPWEMKDKWIESQYEYIFIFKDEAAYPRTRIVAVKSNGGGMWNILRKYFGIKEWFNDPALTSVAGYIPSFGVPEPDKVPPPMFFASDPLGAVIYSQPNSDNSVRKPSKDVKVLVDAHGDCTLPNIFKVLMKEDPVFNLKYRKAMFGSIQGRRGAGYSLQRLQSHLDIAVKTCEATSFKR